MTPKEISTGQITIGKGNVVIMAGPCVLEDREMAIDIALEASAICRKIGLEYIFKASFDKANRTSISSFRGPGIEKGLQWLQEVRDKAEVPVLTDIHEPWQAEPVSQVADILQVPAFLCRQTDLLVAAAKTGKPLNIKKAQFMSGPDMGSVADKCRQAGNSEVMLCERGTSMGYNQLVVDMRSLVIMRALGCPVVFDGTHSVQMPGGKGTSSGGDRRFVQPLVRAAVAVGIDGLFLETHPDPDHAKSDGPNMVPLDRLEKLLREVKVLDDVVKNSIGMSSLDWVEG
jgi:2-dehydro-3-deoxyphosphooctonate aldolase (KDO 8-P synthase)